MKISKSFRPLSGNYISQQCTPVLAGNHRFPSPVGELHFSMLSGRINRARGHRVSVPCRGTTFLNSYNFTYKFCLKCFRPLSGNYISQSCKGCNTDWIAFPSPVGELHFSKRNSILLSIHLLFPSPVGELHFSI